MSFTPFPELETDRLILRSLSKEDAYDIFKIRSDDRVNQYIDRDKMLSIDEAAYFIYKINNGIEKEEWLYWLVVDKMYNKAVGTVCLWNIVREDDKAEIGYELMWDAQGKGYMNEAVSKVIAFGFDTMNVKTITAVVKDANSKSIRLLEKMGFALDTNEDGQVTYVLLADSSTWNENGVFL